MLNACFCFHSLNNIHLIDGKLYNISVYSNNNKKVKWKTTLINQSSSKQFGVSLHKSMWITANCLYMRLCVCGCGWGKHHLTSSHLASPHATWSHLMSPLQWVCTAPRVEMPPDAVVFTLLALPPPSPPPPPPPPLLLLQSTHPLIHSSTHLSVYLPTCLLIYLPTYLPTYPSTHLPVYPSAYLSAGTMKAINQGGGEGSGGVDDRSAEASGSTIIAIKWRWLACAVPCHAVACRVLSWRVGSERRQAMLSGLMKCQIPTASQSSRWGQLWSWWRRREARGERREALDWAGWALIMAGSVGYHHSPVKHVSHALIFSLFGVLSTLHQLSLRSVHSS